MWLIAICLFMLGVVADEARAQPLIPLAPPQAPIFNPSNPSTVPQARETPVTPNAPSVRGGPGGQHLCSVFRRGPCLPEYLPPIGQDLRLTIVSTDQNDPVSKPSGDATKDGSHATSGDAKPLDTIREIYAALRACWIPPPRSRRVMAWNILCALPINATAK